MSEFRELVLAERDKTPEASVNELWERIARQVTVKQARETISEYGPTLVQRVLQNENRRARHVMAELEAALDPPAASSARPWSARLAELLDERVTLAPGRVVLLGDMTVLHLRAWVAANERRQRQYADRVKLGRALIAELEATGAQTVRDLDQRRAA